MLPSFVVLIFASAAYACVGEYERCPSGDCVLISSDCGKCKQGEFLCPDRITCAANSRAYEDCPLIPFYNWTLTSEARLDDLLKRLTLKQKVLQLKNDAPAIEELSIPAYNWLNEAIHGAAVRTGDPAVSFPNGCAMGATWNPDLVGRIANAIGVEQRGKHNAASHEGLRKEQRGITTYTPNINLVKDPRWGRAAEVYGECPLHTGKLVVEYVKGLQSSNDDRYMQVAACCKHFAAYDVEDLANGTQRFAFDANVPLKDLWETYLPHFRKCIVEGRAGSVMCSYNAVNGVPACGNKFLLTDVLRWALLLSQV